MEAKIHFFFVVIRKFILDNRKRVNKFFAWLLGLIGFLGVLPMFSDTWRQTIIEYWNKFITGLPAFFEYFYDPRAFIIYIIVLFIWITLIYYKHEARFLELALKQKREIANEIAIIKSSCPANHYLGLILGKLNSAALDIKNRRGSDIISTIDKNIKKYERVYWVSEDEIGIIFYEVNTKDEQDFINYVIKNKLKNEIGISDATKFLDNITFAMSKVGNSDDLFKIESNARIKLILVENAKNQNPADKKERDSVNPQG